MWLDVRFDVALRKKIFDIFSETLLVLSALDMRCLLPLRKSKV